MLYLNYYIVDKKSLITRVLLAQFLWTSLTGYDCLPHDIIIAKFEAYDLSKNTLKLLLRIKLLFRKTKTMCENMILIQLLVWCKEKRT